jgi:plasmid stabilization system protein ParE
VKVKISEAAFIELMQIGRAIKIDNPKRAESFVSEIYEKCQSLSSMARAFPLLPRWEEQGIRRRPFGDYLIFYRIIKDQIDILHILHGARDYEAILFPVE